jgi:capsular polysaccharide biosynthesis protein
MGPLQMKDFVRMCKENKNILIFFFLIVSIPMFTAFMVMPPTYKAIAKVMIENSRRANLELSGNLSERASENPPAPARINSLVELVKSRNLIGRAVRSVYPGKEPEQIEAEITKLQNRIETRLIPASTMIEISYSDKDRVNVSKIVRSLAETFQQAANTLTEGDNIAEFYRTHLKLAADNLRNEYATLNNLQLQAGMVTRFAEEQRLVETERSTLMSTLTDTDMKISGLQARILTLQEQVKAQPEWTRASTESSPNPEWISLKDRLNILESEKISLLTKYQEGDRLVQDKIYEINQLKSRIEKTERVVESKNIVSINPLRQVLEQDLVRTLAALQETTKIRNEAAAKIRVVDVKYSNLNKYAYALQSQEQAVDVSRRSYGMYFTKVSDAQFVDSMSHNMISTVTIVDMPDESVPQQSDPIKSSALPFVFGSLVALSGVFLKERLNPRIGDGTQAKEYLKLPILTQVSEVKTNGKGNGKSNGHSNGKSNGAIDV